MATVPSRPLALVTGASSGIGEAFARAYAARGCDVALVARRADRLEALAAELSGKHGIEAFAVRADLSLFEGHKPVLDAIAARGRGVDILVNNAGFGIAQTFTGVPWERQRDFLMTLAVAPCGLAYGVLPGMVARGRGSIINIASMTAFSPGVAGHTLYPAVKGMMVRFSESLDAEYRDKGVRVTAVCPGFTQTEFAEVNGTADAMGKTPRRLFNTAEEVAEASIRGNEAGRILVIPGWWNRLAAWLMQALPHGLVRHVIGRVSAKFVIE